MLFKTANVNFKPPLLLANLISLGSYLPVSIDFFKSCRGGFGYVFRRRLFIGIMIWCFGANLIHAQAQCDPATLIDRQIRASDTDPNIPFELATHWAWINPGCVQKNILLVYFVGTIDNPLSTTYFLSLAANNGYHVVSLKYPNDISAQSPCRNSADSACYSKVHREVIEGVDLHPDVDVDSNNCISNRLLKLLTFLDEQYPLEGWGTYFDGMTISWSQTALAGHSQGGGHAAFIAKDHPVQRVIMFASPNDYSAYFNDGASWTQQQGATPDSVQFAFGNLYDDIADFGEELVQWEHLGLSAFGDTVHVDPSSCPYAGSHMLYTKEQQPGLAVNHSLMVRDSETPLDLSGIPIYTPVWRYLLGIPCLISEVGPGAYLGTGRVYPNPFHDRTTIELPYTKQGILQVDIMDAVGRVVRSLMVAAGAQIIVERGALRPGPYYYRVSSQGSVSTCGQILVR